MEGSVIYFLQSSLHLDKLDNREQSESKLRYCLEAFSFKEIYLTVSKIILNGTVNIGNKQDEKWRQSVLFSFSLVSVSFAFLPQKKEKEMEKVTQISYYVH